MAAVLRARAQPWTRSRQVRHPQVWAGCCVRASRFSSSSRSEFNPANTEHVFRSRTSADIFGTALLLQLCASKSLVSGLCSVLLYAAETRSAALTPLLWLVRRTYFRHFAAGENIADCRNAADRLHRLAGARVIVDYSTEEAENTDALEGNLQNKVRLVAAVADSLPETGRFVAVKLTALVSPALLERVTVELLAVASPSAPILSAAELSGLSAREQVELSEAVERLCALAKEARRHDVRLLLDAEQTDRQPAINLLARAVLRRANARGGGAPVVYNTFQMYLADDRETMLYGRGSLEAELAYARANGYIFAAKVVRGAYMASETAAGRRARVQISKEATDQAYDSAVQSVLESIACDDSAALVIATHNEASVVGAVGEMARLGIRPDHPHVHFAQILGMADHLTYALGGGGGGAAGTSDVVGGSDLAHGTIPAPSYNATKLLVYGDFYEVLPWLLRRLQENQDVLGAAARERSLLWAELRRRATDGSAHR